MERSLINNKPKLEITVPDLSETLLVQWSPVMNFLRANGGASVAAPALEDVKDGLPHMPALGASPAPWALGTPRALGAPQVLWLRAPPGSSWGASPKSAGHGRRSSASWNTFCFALDQQVSWMGAASSSRQPMKPCWKIATFSLVPNASVLGVQLENPHQKGSICMH